MYGSDEKTKLKGAVKLLLGAMFVGTAIWGYAPLPHEFLAEFTFISNMTGGLLLLTDGILNLTGKGLPKILHLNVSAGMLLVFFICMATLATPTPFNFGGAFFFLHVINPLVMAFSYIFLCRDSADSTFKHLLAVPVFSLLYLVFDYILGNIRGHFVYGFFMPESLPIWMAVLIGAIVYLIMMALGLLLFTLNKKIHKNSAE